jgi:hypothetical protein
MDFLVEISARHLLVPSSLSEKENWKLKRSREWAVGSGQTTNLNTLAPKGSF